MNAMAKVRTEDSKFLETLQASEVGAKILEASTRAVVAQRTKIASELTARTAENGSKWPKLVTASEKALEGVRAAEEALAVARAKLAAANAARASESNDYSLTRARLEGELGETASPLIDAFIAEMRADMEASRKKLDTADRSRKHPITGHALFERVSNSESIRQRVAAAFEAIAAAQAMKLIPDQSSVDAAIAELRRNLPAVGQAQFSNEEQTR